MAIESAADLGGFFNAAEFGQAATYTPPDAGAAVACTVLIEDADVAHAGFAGRAVTKGKIVMVRAAEVAAPAANGVFTVAASGRSYVVVGKPDLDEVNRDLWLCMTA